MPQAKGVWLVSHWFCGIMHKTMRTADALDRHDPFGEKANWKNLQISLNPKDENKASVSSRLTAGD